MIGEGKGTGKRTGRPVRVRVVVTPVPVGVCITREVYYHVSLRCPSSGQRVECRSKSRAGGDDRPGRTTVRGSSELAAFTVVRIAVGRTLTKVAAAPVVACTTHDGSESGSGERKTQSDDRLTLVVRAGAFVVEAGRGRRRSGVWSDTCQRVEVKLRDWKMDGSLLDMMLICVGLREERGGGSRLRQGRGELSVRRSRTDCTAQIGPLDHHFGHHSAWALVQIGLAWPTRIANESSQFHSFQQAWPRRGSQKGAQTGGNNEERAIGSTAPRSCRID